MRVEESFDVLKQGAHASAFKCDAAHLSSVHYPGSRLSLSLCENTPMGQVFDINVIRAELDRLMKKHKIARKPLAKAAGLGETAIRDIFDDRRNDVRASTLLSDLRGNERP
jgi:hypothetical protein